MRIAIVGAGVSGLRAGRLLHTEHEIVVYEAASYRRPFRRMLRFNRELRRVLATPPSATAAG